MNRINNKNDAYKKLRKYFNDEYELMLCLHLDNDNKLLNEHILKKGDKSSCTLMSKDLFEIDLINMSHNGKIILAHNHTNGRLKVSREDIESKEIIEDYSLTYGINIVDYLIFTDEGVISYK